LVMRWMGREAVQELWLGWRRLLDQLRPILSASLMMAGLVMVVRWALAPSGVAERLVGLVLAAALGVTAYAAAICWQGGALVGEIGEVAGWLKRPFMSSRRAGAGERA